MSGRATLAPARTAPHARAALLAAALATALGCGKPLPAIDAFAASPTDVGLGQPVQLAWSVRGAQSLAITPGVGKVTGSAVTVTPQVDTTYRLTATNAGGSVFREVVVTVHVNAPPATIFSFTSDLLQAAPGGAVTLHWVVGGATTLALDNGAPALSASDNQVVVHPTVSTTYTLSAQGPADKQPATAQVFVRVVPLPQITSFTQTPPGPVQRGSAVTLAWQSDGLRFALDDGAGTSLDVGSATSARVRPLRDGTWTLTATGPTGKSTAQLPIVLGGAQAASLVYADPPAGGEAIRLERDPASPSGSLWLLVKAAQALAISALALDLPLDGGTAGARDGSARVQLDPATPALPGASWRTISNGFDLDTAQLDPGGAGSAPPAALARLPSTGPLAGVLTVGIAQKPLARCQLTASACDGAKAGDAAIAAGAVLARIRLLVRPEGGAGPVIDPAQLLLPLSGYRAMVRGSGYTSTLFAVGALTAQP